MLGCVAHAMRLKPKAIRLHERTNDYLERKLGGPLPQPVLAERWHVSQASVSRWLNGIVRMPTEAAEELAEMVEVPLEHLINPPAGSTDGHGSAGRQPPTEDFLVQHVGRVSAKGTEGSVEDGPPIRVSRELHDLAKGGTLLAADVIGDCMEPELNEGDLLIYRVTRNVPTGALAVLTLLDQGANGGGNVKRVEWIGEDTVRLTCHKYAPIVVKADRVLFEGIVLESRRRYVR